MNRIRLATCVAVLGAALALASASAPAAPATSGLIPAPGRIDTAYDVATHTLYISGGATLRRYDMVKDVFLAPVKIGGTTGGMDISADGRTLAVANGTMVGGQLVLDLLDLATRIPRRVTFAAQSQESGTFAVAFDATGSVLVSSSFAGSGSSPLRRFDPATGVTTILSSPTSPTMLTPTAGHGYVAITSGNSTAGAFGRYRSGDSTYGTSTGVGWITYEIAISPDAAQLAIPTGAGTYFSDTAHIFPQIGDYQGVTPIGAAYAPLGHDVYFAYAQTDYIDQYDTRSMTLVRRITVPGRFEWVGNQAYVEGRMHVSADGRWLFSTLDGGVFFTSLKGSK